MLRFLRGLARWLGRALDAVLPAGPDAARPSDWTGETSEQEAARRQARFRLRMKEKAGKGGYR